MTQGPRINSDERGFTINKTLAYTIAVGLGSGFFWFGSITAEGMERIAVLQNRQDEDRALILANQTEINALRRSAERVDQRLLSIKESQDRQEIATNEILRYLRNPQAIGVPEP